MKLKKLKSYLIITSLILGSATPTYANDKQYELSIDEKNIINNSLEAIKIAKENQNVIWSGYDISKIPIILFVPDKVSFLFNFTELPEGFTPLNKYPNVAIKKGTENYPKGFNINTPIGNRTGSIFEISDTNTFKVIYHETFHLYQLYLSKKNFYSKSTFNISDYSPEYISLTQIEQKYLSNALISNDKNEILKNLSNFYSIRLERNKNLSKEQIQNEESLEVIEGTAEYTERTFNYIAKNNMNDRLFSEPDYYQSKDAVVFDNLYELNKDLDNSSLSRVRFYRTGFALGMIFDKLGLNSWKKDIESGKTFSEIVKTVVKSSNDNGFIKGIYESKAFKNEIIRNKSYMANLEMIKNEQISDFYKNSGYKVTLKISYDLLSSGVISRTRGESLKISPQQKLLPEGSTVSSALNNFFFQVQGPLISDKSLSEFSQYIFFLKPENINLKVNDKSVDIDKNSGKELQGKINFLDDKFKLNNDRGTIKINKQEIEILIN